MSRTIWLFALILGTTASATFASDARKTGPAPQQRGVASWYGYECSKTASGERYNPMSLTAAHRTLPFGTLVRVTHLGNGREAILRINNRGPFSKGRIIDVSKAAAQQLGMIKSGVAKVEVSVITLASR